MSGMSIHRALALLFLAAAAACGGETASSSAAASTSSGTAGGGGDGGAEACFGLGCRSCDSDDLNAEICLSGETCSGAADCAASLTSTCTENLGTYTGDFPLAGCIADQCVYRIVTAGCPDLTSCAMCMEQGKSQSCGLKATASACAACCETYYAGKDYAPIFQACACGGGASGGACADACGDSALCGGPGPTSDACAGCLASTLLNGGACVTSDAFQASCIHEEGSVFCKKLSQCLATCPAP